MRSLRARVQRLTWGAAIVYVWPSNSMRTVRMSFAVRQVSTAASSVNKSGLRSLFELYNNQATQPHWRINGELSHEAIRILTSSRSNLKSPQDPLPLTDFRSVRGDCKSPGQGRRIGWSLIHHATGHVGASTFRTAEALPMAVHFRRMSLGVGGLSPYTQRPLRR
jgi:hypothetical protein